MNKQILITVLLVIILIFSGVTIYNSSYGVNFSTSASKNFSTNTGSVWEALKSKGLQGDHFTLNIHGKKDGFSKQDCTVTGTTTLGNNVFIPSNSADSGIKNQIIMSSGNTKGKWAATTPVYGVKDTCTNAFDGDAAELTLPPNEKGYYVTARVLGKPTNDPKFGIEGNLLWVNDENGNDLLVLGMVTSNGFQTPSTVMTRTTGKVSAVDITGVFEWNGNVCYFDKTNYCYDAANQYICADKNMCCLKSIETGLYDNCQAPALNTEGVEYCADATYQLVPVGCREYVNEWVFNIGDFVGYMWDTYTDGDFKLANIRFYPVK